MTETAFKIADEKHNSRKEQWKQLLCVPSPESHVAYGYARERYQLETALHGILAPVNVDVPFAVARGVQSGVFLHGPPGCGKTLLVQAAAAHLQIPMVVVQPAHIITGDVGTTGHVVSSLFAAAMETASGGKGTIVFMDEIESFGKRTNNSSGWDVFLSNLLKHLDRLSSTTTGHRVAFVAATNNPGSCEPALLSRLATHIEVGPPDDDSRRAYLMAAVGSVRAEFIEGRIEVEPLVRCARGLTLRQIAQALDALNARFIKVDHVRGARLTQADLVAALSANHSEFPRDVDPSIR